MKVLPFLLADQLTDYKVRKNTAIYSSLCVLQTNASFIHFEDSQIFAYLSDGQYHCP